MTSNVEHRFMFLIASHISSLEKYLLRFLALFFLIEIFLSAFFFASFLLYVFFMYFVY